MTGKFDDLAALCKGVDDLYFKDTHVTTVGFVLKFKMERVDLVLVLETLKKTYLDPKNVITPRGNDYDYDWTGVDLGPFARMQMLTEYMLFPDRAPKLQKRRTETYVASAFIAHVVGADKPNHDELCYWWHRNMDRLDASDLAELCDKGLALIEDYAKSGEAFRLLWTAR